jgi:hypothetical protein
MKCMQIYPYYKSQKARLSKNLYAKDMQHNTIYIHLNTQKY